MLDHKLKWDSWCDCLSTKAQQRMYFLKKLLSFNVNRNMAHMFYCAFIESVLTFCIICWFGNASEAQKKSVRRTVTTASKLLGTTLPSPENIYKDRLTNKANAIVADERHPLASSFNMLPSARRYCSPLFTRNRSNMSFIPQAIKCLNMARK